MLGAFGIRVGERKAVALAFACNFVLLASYYILRPLRDTVATVLGVDQLQRLFTATFVGTLIASTIYAALAARIRLTRLLPGVFWFWLVNVCVFGVLFHYMPRATAGWAASYYVWFSVANLFMISVFWSLMVDVFSAGAGDAPVRADRRGRRARRDHRSTADAICSCAGSGLSGLLALAAVGFAVVIVLMHWLMREKWQLQGRSDEAQQSTLDHALARRHARRASGNCSSRGYALSQAAFHPADDLGQHRRLFLPDRCGRAQPSARSPAAPGDRRHRPGGQCLHGRDPDLRARSARATLWSDRGAATQSAADGRRFRARPRCRRRCS